jgi:hypothetical protein
MSPSVTTLKPTNQPLAFIKDSARFIMDETMAGLAKAYCYIDELETQLQLITPPPQAPQRVQRETRSSASVADVDDQEERVHSREKLRVLLEMLDMLRRHAKGSQSDILEIAKDWDAMYPSQPFAAEERQRLKLHIDKWHTSILNFRLHLMRILLSPPMNPDHDDTLLLRRLQDHVVYAMYNLTYHIWNSCVLNALSLENHARDRDISIHKFIGELESYVSDFEEKVFSGWEYPAV